MPVIVTPQRKGWTRQPQRAVLLNSSHPSSQGIVSFINPAVRDYRIVGTGASFTNWRDGLYFQSATPTLLTKRNRALTGGASFLYYGALGPNGESNNIIAGFGTSTAGNQLFCIQSALGAPIRALIRLTNGGSFATTTSTLGQVDNLTPYVWVVTWDGASDLRIYRDGVDDTSSQSGGVSGAATYDTFSIGGVDRGTDGFANTGAFGSLGIGWNRCLSSREIATLSKNVWGLFEDNSDYIFVSYATSSAQLITISNSSQSNTASDASIAQTHLLSISNSQQSNIASDAAISQTHVLTVSNSTQYNQATDAAIAQTHLVSASNSTQSNQCSDVAVAQSAIAYIGIANSQQINQSSSAAISQTHVVSIASSQQVNTASSVEVTQDNVQRISIANSQQSNQCSAASIQVTHRITASNSSVANQASPIVIGQVHLIFGADSIQVNQCSQVTLKANSQVRPITPSYSTVLIDSDYQQLQINSGYNTINIDSDYRP